jgi:pimeloyl-ACP methyl ester carboxylesterase
MGCEPVCVDAKVRPAQIAPNRETVVLLHGSASTSALWRNTRSALRPLYRCIAPDLIGYGTSPVWPAETSFDLDAELRAIEPLLSAVAAGFIWSVIHTAACWRCTWLWHIRCASFPSL